MQWQNVRFEQIREIASIDRRLLPHECERLTAVNAQLYIESRGKYGSKPPRKLTPEQEKRQVELVWFILQELKREVE